MDEHGSGAGPAPEGSPPSDADASSGQGLSGDTQKRIGLHLRTMYDAIVQQPVPDRFRDLIAKLDASGSDASVTDPVRRDAGPTNANGLEP